MISYLCQEVNNQIMLSKAKSKDPQGGKLNY